MAQQQSPAHSPLPGDEASAGDAMSHLAALTAQRDREMLDVSLAQGVQDLLGALSAGVHRLVGREDEPRHWFRCGVARRGELTLSDPPWADLHQLPAESACPLRVQVMRSRAWGHQALPSAEGAMQWVTVMPLDVEIGMPGVLEVHTDEPLPPSALRSIQTLLKVFGNFQNLLESSQRDTLTGLLNRQTFDATFLKTSMPMAAASSVVQQGERRTCAATTHWLGVVDIDHFKQVNDRFGHLIGDEVLVLVARIMRQSFRHYDRLYRFGGEEFVVLLRGGTEEEAGRAFDRFRANVASYPFPRVGQITVSVGYTGVRPQDTPNEAFKRADEGVYTAKHLGRDQVQCHEALVRQGRLRADDAVAGDIELF